MTDVEALRARAIAVTSRGASDLTVDVLRGALLEVERATRRWEGSDGEHVAHRVTLRLGAAMLALANRDHAVRDELTRAIAVAIAEAPRESLDHLELRWSEAESGGSAYRGPTPTSTTRARALRDYLAALGEHALAGAVDEVSEAAGGVHVRVVGGESDRAPIGEHARALFGPGIAITVVPTPPESAG